MLPFLEPKKMSSVIIARRGKSDIESSPEVDMSEDKLDPGLKEAAEDMMRAFESKSVLDLAKAFKAAHEICESYPHEDESQIEED